MLEEQLTELLRKLDYNDVSFDDYGTLTYKGVSFCRFSHGVIVGENVKTSLSFYGYDIIKAFDDLFEKHKTIKYFNAEKSLKSILGFV